LYVKKLIFDASYQVNSRKLVQFTFSQPWYKSRQEAEIETENK